LRVDGARLRGISVLSLRAPLLVNLGRDVVRVNRLTGHPSLRAKLDIDSHMVDEGPHAADS
jgi:hypothetical protein